MSSTTRLTIDVGESGTTRTERSTEHTHMRWIVLTTFPVHLLEDVGGGIYPPKTVRFLKVVYRRVDTFYKYNDPRCSRWSENHCPPLGLLPSIVVHPFLGLRIVPGGGWTTNIRDEDSLSTSRPAPPPVPPPLGQLLVDAVSSSTKRLSAKYAARRWRLKEVCRVGTRGGGP